MAKIRIFRHYVPLPFLLLGILEFVLFALSVYAGAWLRFSGDQAAAAAYIGWLFPRSLLYASILSLAMISVGLYQARLREGLAGILIRLLAAYILGALTLTFLFYLFPSVFIGRGALGLAFLVSLVGVLGVRTLFYRLIDLEAFKRRTLVLGAGRQARSIAQALESGEQCTFTVLGFVPMPGDTPRVPEALRLDLPADQPLADFCRAQQADEIVVAVDDRRQGMPIEQLLDCRIGGLEVVDVQTFFEREFGKIRVDLLTPSWLVFSDGFQMNAFRDMTKRLLDITASILLLAVGWPFMLLTVLGIWLEEGPRAPVFYRQRRVGQNGVPFDMLKFRSMRVDAEKDGARWAQADDDRKTRVGRVIRKFRIDELPQILNVLRGDMSLVGPRPERPEFVRELARRIPYYDERHRVKPGITGWAQLRYPYAANEHDTLEKLQYDLYYVKNHSFLLDLLILLQTAEVVLWSKGAR